MLIWEVARRYAHALYLSAEGKGLLNIAYEQLNDLSDFVQKDPKLRNFLSAPQVLEESKKDLVRKVFAQRIDRLLVEFLVVLIDKGRIRYLVEIIDEFGRLVEAHQGVGRVTVITAVTLTDSEREQLSRKMAAKTGLKIVLEEKIDPSIIGGLIVLLHDEIIDGSVKHGLNLVRDQLEGVRVH
ncbi:MAG: ATP synthase F1 subunit delta [Candidatus Zixiibacteriota bacterium]